ncbi:MULTISPECIES: phosphoenolpyruvate--protein phosphotransferase [Acutalibacteraceae]|uniref:phosphoenolpyruvate--protein phosphotransferase n=1 Tax=Acutalibacteraceae TaxID=3082771 RepID=UPI0013E8F317|nr:MULTISPECIES: phosphoenolpyruvate--protein phosphotransferase [Acutalibacteraceae]
MTEKTVRGIGVSEGIRIGKVRLLSHNKGTDPNPFLDETQIEPEIERLRKAVEQAALELDGIIRRSADSIGKDKIGVLKGQKGILADPAFAPGIIKLIREKRYSPEKATGEITERFAAVFEAMKNAYMRERAADVRDAGNRLLAVLSGGDRPDLSDIQNPIILISRDLSPSDTVQLNKNVILAFATEKGGATSHTSIFARSLGIPAVVGIAGLTDMVDDGDEVIVDGERGTCILFPNETTVAAYKAKMEAEIEEKKILEKYKDQSAVTKDGYRLIVGANIGSGLDADLSIRQGSESVGLFRTEALYFNRDKLPSEEDQFLEYKKVVQAYSNKEVMIRTLDAGGDKPVKSIPIPRESNPFLGYRAIRLCLARKDLFSVQLRAVLRASAYGKLKIMFPMISGLEELRAAKDCLENAKAQLKAEQIAFDESIKTGIMIEVPSAAIMADVLAKEADFFSIGTNDLIQYTLAADRGNEKVSYLYDYCNPAVLLLIKRVSDAAHANGIPVGICGNMGAETAAVSLHIGLGIDEISMPAGMIPKIKYLIHRQSKEACSALVQSALSCRSAQEVHCLLNEFNRQNGIC